MPLQLRISHARLNANGSMIIFDLNGNQIPELQKDYSIENHKRVLLEADDNCLFSGFDILPPSFHKEAKAWSSYYRQRYMSWEEIKELSSAVTQPAATHAGG